MICVYDSYLNVFEIYQQYINIFYNANSTCVTAGIILLQQGSHPQHHSLKKRRCAREGAKMSSLASFSDARIIKTSYCG